MAVKRKRIPRYSKVQVNGYEYYKTDIEDADGKRIILYGKTREEVYDKEMAALEQIDSATFRRNSPTVAEYCEKWLNINVYLAAQYQIVAVDQRIDKRLENASFAVIRHFYAGVSGFLPAGFHIPLDKADTLIE